MLQVWCPRAPRPSFIGRAQISLMVPRHSQGVRGTLKRHPGTIIKRHPHNPKDSNEPSPNPHRRILRPPCRRRRPKVPPPRPPRVPPHPSKRWQVPRGPAPGGEACLGQRPGASRPWWGSQAQNDPEPYLMTLTLNQRIYPDARRELQEVRFEGRRVKVE
jgi:hypothetical protein